MVRFSVPNGSVLLLSQIPHMYLLLPFQEVPRQAALLSGFAAGPGLYLLRSGTAMEKFFCIL